MLMSMDDIREMNKRKEQEAAQNKGLLPTSVEAPVSPSQQLRDNHGTGGAILRMIGTGLSGGLLGNILTPEISKSSKAQYKGDLDLYNKYREMALVDPQDAAVAEAIEAGVTGPELMALQARAGGVGELSLDQTTLSPGQIRYDAFGNQIAEGGESIVNPTSVMQNAEQIAAGYGIPTGTRAHSDLMAALAEPSGTKEMPDGTTQTFNTVNKVIADWQNGVYGPVAQQGQAGGQAGGAASDGSITPRDVEMANLRKQAMAWDNERQGEFKEKNEFYGRLTEQMDKLGAYDARTGKFRANDAVRDIYGSIDSKFPEWARGDDERMAQALIDQVVEILAVDERGKLKGQGQITEGETKMLRDSLTVLTNMGIGDADMEAEIARLYKNVLGLSDSATNFRSNNPYRKQLEAMADGMPTGFEED